MHNGLRRAPRTALTACMLLVLTAAYVESRHRKSEQTPAFGRSKKEQVLARSLPILPALMPGAGIIESELSLYSGYRASGEAAPAWVEDCVDSASGTNAQLVWSADTGELLHASQWKNREPTVSADAHSTPEEAITLAWDWFHVLPLCQDHEA